MIALVEHVARALNQTLEGAAPVSKRRNGERRSRRRRRRGGGRGRRAERPRRASTPRRCEPLTREQVEALRRERDDLRDQLLRRRAEFENYRKRVERDRQQAGIGRRRRAC